MKTRIIKTRIWSDDEKFCELSPLGKLGFLYYITNERIGMSGMYECPTRTTKFEITVNDLQLGKIKDELSSNYMVLFKDGWIYVINAIKHNKYRNSPDNEKAYQKEIALIPDVVRRYFDSSVRSSVNGTVHSTKKQETINKKQETRNKKPKYTESFEKFWDSYPNKEGKKMAFDIWKRKDLEGKHEMLISFVEEAKQTKRWKEGFIKQPTTFLNAESWEDDLSAYGKQREVVSVK